MKNVFIHVYPFCCFFLSLHSLLCWTPFLAHRSLDLSFNWEKEMINWTTYTLSCMHWLAFDVFESWVPKNVFSNWPVKSFFFRGVEWADSLLENRSLAVLCSALRFKLKVKNLFTKSALKIAVYSSLEFTVVESWNPKVFCFVSFGTGFHCLLLWNPLCVKSTSLESRKVGFGYDLPYIFTFPKKD